MTTCLPVIETVAADEPYPAIAPYRWIPSGGVASLRQFIGASPSLRVLFHF
jgi:hypothetical protein